ncbi:hypothetical protein [Vulcanococcus sp.]|uniref:hypothetical protein n=1 Tax=Vulcanococcus sp. TaxID=2856995 RepID=UPI003F69552E
MTNQHPTPPPELVQQWMDDLYGEPGQFVSSDDKALAARAARWGYEQHEKELLDAMHAVVPQPYEPDETSAVLKRQALAALHAIAVGANDMREQHQDLDTIRKALEQLDD